MRLGKKYNAHFKRSSTLLTFVIPTSHHWLGHSYRAPSYNGLRVAPTANYDPVTKISSIIDTIAKQYLHVAGHCTNRKGERCCIL